MRIVTACAAIACILRFTVCHEVAFVKACSIIFVQSGRDFIERTRELTVRRIQELIPVRMTYWRNRAMGWAYFDVRSGIRVVIIPGRGACLQVRHSACFLAMTIHTHSCDDLAAMGLGSCPSGCFPSTNPMLFSVFMNPYAANDVCRRCPLAAGCNAGC
jgi:hypothetical protein